MGKRPSIIKAAINRLDGLMAPGESRFLAKKAVREEARQAREAAQMAGQPLPPIPWTVTTGKMHSYGSRDTYQEQVLRFINWARNTQGIRTLAALDERADELATLWLEQQIAAGKAAATLHTAREALRMFFSNRTLTLENLGALPRRERTDITRSRRPAKRDRFINRAHWNTLIRFVRATGLRYHEVRDLRTHDVYRGQSGGWHVHVRNGKGGKMRIVTEVLAPPDEPTSDLTLPLAAARATLDSLRWLRAGPSAIPTTARAQLVDDAQALAINELSGSVLPGSRDWIDELLASRPTGAHVFERIPDALDVQAERRWYAQTLYRAHSGRELPPAEGRLKPSDYDREAALIVSHQLGHNRLDVTLRHYLR